MSWTPYVGNGYLSWPEIRAWCRALAEAHPELVHIDVVGESRHGNPLLLLTVARQGDAAPTPVADRSAFWLDGGTHAAEWTGVMSVLFTLSRWIEGLLAGDPDLVDWFSHHAAYVLPCMSPDGYQALHDGAPYLRSTLRPPPEGQLRIGLEPRDLDGDGRVLWMRWRHPAGPYVQDETLPLFMRNRRIDDDPAEAWFVCSEGELLEWDGHRWMAATLRHGLDLNRNFPAAWQPFQMFGMDGGEVPLSEPESRAVVDAVRARPGIACAVTNHTYTGAMLTQPYRSPSPLPAADLDLMEVLARDAVRGTGYRVMRVHPEFVYDPKQDIVGVWADTLSTVLGIPGYTLELWDPFAAAGVENVHPAEFFHLPDEAVLRGLFTRFSGPQPVGPSVSPWQPFEHPQLGPVEIGGLDYMRTVRNPPEDLLAAECERGFTVADRVRRAVPRMSLRLHSQELGGGNHELTAVLENTGFLSTSGLAFAESRGIVPRLSLRLALGPGLERVSGPPSVDLGHLDGWGTMRVAGSRHSLYPDLPSRGHRAVARWIVHGQGTARVRWQGGRAGAGEAERVLAPT